MKHAGRTNTLCGDSMYKAPEIHLKNSYNKKVDAWSFGVVLYVMDFGYYPSFIDQNELQTMKNVIQFASSDDTIEDRDANISHVKQSELGKNPQFWDLLNKLLCSEDERITVAQALKHPFFKS